MNKWDKREAKDRERRRQEARAQGRAHKSSVEPSPPARISTRPVQQQGQTMYQQLRKLQTGQVQPEKPAHARFTYERAVLDRQREELSRKLRAERQELRAPVDLQGARQMVKDAFKRKG